VIANEESVATLVDHLRVEVECLEHLHGLLENEAVALRRMDLVELDETVRRKEKVIDRQQVLSRARTKLLSKIDFQDRTPTLSELVKVVDTSAGIELAEVVVKLRLLASDITEQNHKNRIFADSGQSLVNGLFRLFDLGRSRISSTYAADGQIRGSVLNSQGNKGRACLV
jgi:flagellar biosynthesis/type III secretory pathway chaperone